MISKKLYDYIGADRIKGCETGGRVMTKGVHGPAVEQKLITLEFQIHGCSMVFFSDRCTIVESDSFDLLVSVHDIAKIEKTLGYRIGNYGFKRENLVGSPSWKADNFNPWCKKALENIQLNRKNQIEIEKALGREREHRKLRANFRKRKLLQRATDQKQVKQQRDLEKKANQPQIETARRDAFIERRSQMELNRDRDRKQQEEVKWNDFFFWTLVTVFTTVGVLGIYTNINSGVHNVQCNE